MFSQQALQLSSVRHREFVLQTVNIKEKELGMLVAIIVGAVLVVGAIVATVIFLKNNKKKAAVINSTLGTLGKDVTSAAGLVSTAAKTVAK